jgi:hypothetical protein
MLNRERKISHVWDDAVVAVLDKQLGTADPEATARKLELLYPSCSDDLLNTPKLETCIFAGVLSR